MMMLEKFNLNEKVKGDNLSSDSDHTRISRKFYSVYWGKSLSSDIEKYDGKIGNYRGETLITFKTISGCVLRLLDNTVEKKEIHIESEDRLNIICNSKEIKKKHTN